MILIKVHLHNFGVYEGDNIFEFHNEKPIVLIGGLNGRGKTTFLEAVLLALYGASSFAVVESAYSSYSQYLIGYTNKADGTMRSFVELEFKMDALDQDLYKVKREWSGKGKRIRDKVFVEKNGEYNNFLTENWAMFIENLLPSGLSNFFFFDGEKIAEIATEATNSQMKGSIKALLGITVLDVLENDINRIIAKIGKEQYSEFDYNEMIKLKNKKEEAEAALNQIDESIILVQETLESEKKKLENLQQQYTAKGGDIAAQQQDLLDKRRELEIKLSMAKEKLIGSAGSAVPLSMIEPLLKQIQEQARKEQESQFFDFAMQKIDSLSDMYYMGNAANREAVEKFIEYLRGVSKESAVKRIYNLSDHSIYLLEDLINKTLKNEKNEILTEYQEIKQTQKAYDENESYLSVDIDEKAIAKIYRKIKACENTIADYEVEVERLQKNRVSTNGESIRAASAYNNFVEKILSNLELGDDNSRKLKYAHLSLNVLTQYKIQLQKRKVGILAETMTNCYKKLANKKNLISKIVMDPETLDFSYIDFDGAIVSKKSLSAGEKQLMVIALLWALAVCSKRKLPIIIDTPLSRMDSNHRVALIKTYFPQASEQTIILSTDSEINRYYHNIMKDNIGDEFTLVYDDQYKRTTIERGYFL